MAGPIFEYLLAIAVSTRLLRIKIKSWWTCQRKFGQKILMWDFRHTGIQIRQQLYFWLRDPMNMILLSGLAAAEITILVHWSTHYSKVLYTISSIRKIYYVCIYPNLLINSSVKYGIIISVVKSNTLYVSSNRPVSIFGRDHKIILCCRWGLKMLLQIGQAHNDDR